jgi:hypothetical protein
MVLRCGHCNQLFCFDCDAFIHEILHNCPGCEAAGAPVLGDADKGGMAAGRSVASCPTTAAGRATTQMAYGVSHDRM